MTSKHLYLIAIALVLLVVGQSYYFTFNDVEYNGNQEGGIFLISCIELALATVLYGRAVNIEQEEKYGNKHDED